MAKKMAGFGFAKSRASGFSERAFMDSDYLAASCDAIPPPMLMMDSASAEVTFLPKPTLHTRTCSPFLCHIYTSISSSSYEHPLYTDHGLETLSAQTAIRNSKLGH